MPKGTVLSRRLLFFAAHCLVVACLLPHAPRLLRQLRSRTSHAREWPHDVVNLTRILVGHGQAEPTEYVAGWLRAANFSVRVDRVPQTTRSNILATLPGVDVSDADVLLMTHLDVVPGGPELNLTGADGRLVGRGTTDARGIAASMMLALRALRHARVALLLVTGEETTHDGVLHAFDALPLKANVALVNGEPTQLRLGRAHKGVLKFEVAASGTACHSGYPHLGRSAVLSLLDYLQRLRAVEWPCAREDPEHCTTMNIGVIQGGEAPNIVPDAARAVLAFRTIGPAQQVLDVANSIAASFDNVRLEKVRSAPPVEFHVPNRAAERFGTIALSYNTDVSTIQGRYGRAVLFGASNIDLAHTAHESVAVEDLESMPPAYVDIVTELLEDAV